MSQLCSVPWQRGAPGTAPGQAAALQRCVSWCVFYSPQTAAVPRQKPISRGTWEAQHCPCIVSSSPPTAGFTWGGVLRRFKLSVWLLREKNNLNSGTLHSFFYNILWYTTKTWKCLCVLCWFLTSEFQVLSSLKGNDGKSKEAWKVEGDSYLDYFKFCVSIDSLIKRVG